jgi:ribosomal protein S18 acetylase RimI-like enzyme
MTLAEETAGPILRIREASAADQERLIPLINSAFAIETFLEGERTNPERMAEAMTTGIFLLAEDADGRIAACVYVETRGERGYVGQLAVDPARQGQGIGRRMMRASEEHLRRLGCVAVDIIVLGLRPDLPPFYERLGFVETSRGPFTPVRKVKEGFECQAITMSKNL